jgi:hypothetical protein
LDGRRAPMATERRRSAGAADDMRRRTAALTFPAAT